MGFLWFNKKLKLVGDVGFVITENCPFQCPHCLRGDRRPNTLSKKVIDKFLKKAEINGIVYLYGGEPLMRSELVSYLINQIYKKGNHPKRIQVVTNGSVCPEKFEKFIYTLKANAADFKIIISDDLYHKEERERLHGGEDNLCQIIAAYDLILKKYGYFEFDSEFGTCCVQPYNPFEGGQGVIKVGRGVNIPGSIELPRFFQFDPRFFVKDLNYSGSISIQTDGRVISAEEMSWDESDKHFGQNYNILKRSLKQILPRR